MNIVIIIIVSIKQKITKIMTTSIPNAIIEWIQHLGVQDQFIATEIESGRAIGKIMKIIVPGYNLQLLSSNSAVNRVSNWNNLINQLKKINIRVSQDQKNKIINGNHDIVYQILGKLQDYQAKNQKQTEVDISKINPKSQIVDSSSLLQLFILTIMKYFNLSPKQSVALLSSECKYLAHILVKGLKGQFKPIQNFLSQLIKHVELINGFCKNKQNQIFFIRAIKPSLISKSDIASQRGMILLQQFLAVIPHKTQIVKEHFISTLILAIRRHPHLIQQIVRFTINTTQYSKDILIMYKTQATEAQIQNIILSLINVSKETQQSQNLFKLKQFGEFVNKSIDNIRNADTVVSSMNILMMISADNTDLLSDPERGSKFIQNIQEVTISKKSDNIVFIQQLFSMLSTFGKDKNQLAPAIFKILVSKYQNCINIEQSVTFIENFKQILQQFPTIPFTFIIQAVNSRVQGNTLAISQVQMQFFRDVINNNAIDLKSALVIYNAVSKLLVQQPTYVNTGTSILLAIVKKFQSESIVIDLTIKLIKVCLAMHFANVKRLSTKRKSVIGNAKSDPQEIISKSKNIGLQQFIYKITQEGIKQVNKNTEPLISYSLIQVQSLSKENSIGLKRIVSLFGNPDQIIKKYQAQAKKLEEQQMRKQQKKHSKLKQSAWSGLKNRYNNEQTGQNKQRSSSHLSSSDQALRTVKLRTKLDPMLLSHANVHPNVLKGLQKYQKSYLTKVQKAQQEQARKKQQDQRQIELKKIFQRKMIEKGISVNKAKQDQFRYIYQFGQKQKQINQDTVKNNIDLPFYRAQLQQQRDTKGIQYAIKKYQRIIKLYYNIYSGHIKPKNLDSFDQIAQKVNLLYSANLWKFVKDHALDEFISVKQVQYLSKKINHSLQKKYDDSHALDYEGFENFIIQASISMFTRPPKDLRGKPISQLIEQTISRLKLYASDNRVNQKLFDDPDNIFYNETQAVKQLNRKLQDNPDYILPEGYKKITEKKVIYTHRIFLDAMSPSYKDVYEIINQLLYESIGVHIIEPFTTYETVAKARPTLYFKQRQEGEVNSQRLSAFLKKQVAKIPIKDRQVGKQVAGVLDQIIQAVQFGHERIGVKYQNKLLKQKKMIQQEQMRKQQQQKRRWAQRQRQIKSALVKHKQVVQQKKKQQQQKRQEQKRKQEQEKRRRQQQEKRLKRKVQSYQNKKKQDQERRKKQQVEQKRKQKQDAQKKKRQIQQTKRKIQQVKQKKQQQEKQKKLDQQAAQKQKKIQQRKKLQQDQKRRKELIQQYKNKKGSDINKSQISSMSPQENKSQVKVLDSGLKGNIQRKKLV